MKANKVFCDAKAEISRLTERLEWAEAEIAKLNDECGGRALIAMDLREDLEKAKAEVSAMAVTMSETNLAMIDLQRRLVAAEAELHGCNNTSLLLEIRENTKLRVKLAEAQSAFIELWNFGGVGFVPSEHVLDVVRSLRAKAAGGECE